MNTRNLWIAAAGGAVLTTLVSNVPVVAFINLLLCAGFWGGAVFAVWLYRRLTGSLTARQGVWIGALTGVFAGVLGFSISFLGLAGLQGLVNEIRLFAGPENAGSLEYSITEVLSFNTAGVAVNILFGTIGGMIGGAIFHRDAVSRTNRMPSQEAVAVEQA